MKKIICVILTLLMLFSALPVMAAGDTVAGASNAYFKVGGGYYSTLKGALAAAPKASDKTVYLLKDATISEGGLTVPSGENVSVEFGGHTLNVAETGKYFISNMYGTVTLKNGTLNVTKGIVVLGGGHLIVDRMSYNVTCSDSNARPAVKLSSTGKTELTVNESNMKTVGPGEALVLVEYATDATINLVNRTVLEYAGVLDSAIQNCGAIAVQQSWGTGVNSEADSSNTDLVLNVGSESKIINTAPAINEEYVASAIVMQTKGSVILNLEKGATVEIDRATGKSKSYHIASTKYDAKLTVNDRGANWVASAKSLTEGGVYLSSVCNYDETVIAWAKGDELLPADKLYSDENATEAAILRPIYVKKQDFDLLDGAAVRTVQSERAIRFSTVVSHELIRLLGDRVTFGTLIAEGSSNPIRTTGRVYEFFDRPLVAYGKGTSVYHAALFFEDGKTDREAYGMTLSAISYMTVQFSDGTEKTFYSEFDYQNVRSMRQIAEALEADGFQHSVVEHILGIFANDPPKVENGTSVLVGFCTGNSLYDGAFNSQIGWKAAGMGYIIRTADGKIIAIDGGYAEDAYGFYSLLREYCGKEKVTVDYWILTHPHGDHVGALFAMAENSGIRDNLEIKNIVFHFPSDFNDGGETSNANIKAHNLATRYGANVINPVKGQVINAGAAEITFLYVCTNYKSYKTANEISLVFTVETEKKVMFTGDVYTAGLTEVYNEYGSSLKCDILQMPHHFLCDTGYKPFYEAVDASAVLLPTCIAGYKAMYNDSSYKNSTKHKANDWAAQNADEVYKAFEGTYEIPI